MPPQGPRQERRRRGGNPRAGPVGLSPQPGLDVQESVGDVEPGIEQTDIVTAGRLNHYNIEWFIETINCLLNFGASFNSFPFFAVNSQRESDKVTEKRIKCW